MTDELYQKAFTVNEERARCEKIQALVATTEQEVHESALGQILHAAKADLQSSENDLYFAEMELRIEMLAEHRASVIDPLRTDSKQLGCGRIVEKTEVVYPSDKAVTWAIAAGQPGLLTVVKRKFKKVATTMDLPFVKVTKVKQAQIFKNLDDYLNGNK